MDYVLGVDVSKYNIYRNNGIDISDGWNPDRATKPIDFVIQRVSYASSSPYVYKDQALDWLYEQALKIPVRGCYHYFGSGSNYQKQMDTMLKAIEGKDYHFLVVDYEKMVNNLDGRTFAELFEMIKQLKVITNKKVMAYFNYDVYVNYMRPFGANNIIANHDIWYAFYQNELYFDWGRPPVVPFPTQMKLWQNIAGDVPGSPRVGKEYGTHQYQTGIDVNRWMGTKEELYTWANVPIVTEEEPPVEEPPIIIPPTKITLPQTVKIDNISGLNSRDIPSVMGKVIGYTPYNTNIVILEMVNGLDGNIWGKTEKGWSCLFLKPSKYFTEIKSFDLYDVGDYSPPIVVPPTHETLPKTVKITNIFGLNIRNEPTTQSSIVGYKLYTTQITITKIVTGLDGNIWGKVDNGWVCLLLKSSNKYFTEITDLSLFDVEIYVPVVETKLYYKLRHDTENPKWGYKSRVITLAANGLGSIKVAYPETIRIEGGKGNITLSPAWVRFFDSINTENASRYTRKRDSGWFNRGTWPTVEQLSFGGNVVEVTKIEGDKAYIKCYYNDDAPPSLDGNFYDPSRIHYFSVVDRYGKVTSSPVGHIRTLVIANNKNEKLWIPLNQLVKVDKLSVYMP